ncbi:proton-activated chloride channel-like isoform X2 [Ptychodera flava]
MKKIADKERENDTGSFYDSIQTKDEENLLNASIDSVTPQCKDPKHLFSHFVKGFLAVFYLSLVAVAGIVAYNTINVYVESQKRPVTSITYKEMQVYPAPGIVIYSSDINAVFLSCGHYYNDIVEPPTLDPNHKNCTFVDISYPNPYFPERFRKAVVFRGPTKLQKKEILFINFSLNLTARNFSGIEYLLFPNWYGFWNSSDKAKFIRECDINNPTWTFSGGMLTWIKLALTETYYLDNSRDSEFDVEASMVKYNDPRPPSEKMNELFFVMFQWRDKFITEAHLVTTVSPWNTIGVLCGVFLTLIKAGEFATKSIKWLVKARRSFQDQRRPKR